MAEYVDTTISTVYRSGTIRNTLYNSTFTLTPDAYHFEKLVIPAGTSDQSVITDAKFILLSASDNLNIKVGDVANSAIVTDFIVLKGGNLNVYITNPSASDVTINLIAVL